jgi:hypothetical protein
VSDDNEKKQNLLQFSIYTSAAEWKKENSSEKRKMERESAKKKRIASFFSMGLLIFIPQAQKVEQNEPRNKSPAQLESQETLIPLEL